MVSPYVYKITHKITGQFYIGARWANTVPASEDLGIVYFTSSTHPLVKTQFAEFTLQILMEVDNADAALLQEQTLISAHWGDPLLLNRVKWIDPKFRCGGHSEQTKAKMSAAKKGKPPNNKGKKMSAEWLAKVSARAKLQIHSPERRLHMSVLRLGNQMGLGNKSRAGQKNSSEMNAKISQALKGKIRGPMSTEQKALLSTAALNRPRFSCINCRHEMPINSLTRHKCQ